MSSNRDLSTEDSLVFGMALRGDMEGASQFTLCYCNDQNDKTLADLGDGETTYTLTEDRRCDDALAGDGAELLKDRAIAEHACEQKCATGCTGPFCYCDGYQPGVASTTLCLPPALCRDACDAMDDCGGISVHDTLPQCTLIPSSSSCLVAGNSTASASTAAQDEESLLFTKRAGTACTDLADFGERAGSLFVTSRVEVAVDYVLHPGQDGSVELTSPERLVVVDDVYDYPNKTDLTYEHDPVFNFIP